VLIRLDATPPRTQLEMARGQLFSTQAFEARLIAEQMGAGAIAFPPDLMAAKSDPRAAAAMALQQRLFTARRETLAGEIAVVRDNIAGLEAQMSGLIEARQSKEEQLRLLREEIKGQRELANDGYLPRNRLFEQERLLAALNAQTSEDIGNIGRTRQAIAEAKSRILNRQQEFSRDVQAQMADVQRDTQSMLTRMQALTFDVANTEIKSPADGVIVGLAAHTVGGVVQAGTVLMEVVPGDEPLKVEAQIAPQMIDKVKVGLPVDILFSAFNQAITPKVPGTVVSVSADVLFDPNSRQPYYKAQIVVTPEGMKKLRDHKIKAGMPAEVFVRTGERTAYNYLMKPLRDRLRAAMTEQ
nr:HlyD family type I secretion periplasmic adaptor subunit [Burkholderiaceae bacterium]